MKKGKVIKLMSVILSLLFMLTVVISNISLATEATVSDVLAISGDSNVTGVAKNVVGTIVTVMRIVGMGIAIIMLTYVAIKYMSAAPAEKAEFKKSATAYIVGAIVLFGTTGLLGMFKGFADANL